MFLNYTALSFSTSAILSALIAYQGFSVWRRQRNPMSKVFAIILIFFFLYFAVRAIASLFFVNSSFVLNLSYIISHIFEALAMAYIAKFTMMNLHSQEKVNLVFGVVLILFGISIGLNIFLPNQPSFNYFLYIIEWGPNKYVAIFHSILNWIVILGAAFLFLYKARQNWEDQTVRWRSLLIACGLLAGALIVVPRNVFRTPLVIFISDVGFVLAFLLIFWGTIFSYPQKQT